MLIVQNSNKAFERVVKVPSGLWPWSTYYNRLYYWFNPWILHQQPYTAALFLFILSSIYKYTVDTKFDPHELADSPNLANYKFEPQSCLKWVSCYKLPGRYQKHMIPMPGQRSHVMWTVGFSLVVSLKDLAWPKSLLCRGAEVFSLQVMGFRFVCWIVLGSWKQPRVRWITNSNGRMTTVCSFCMRIWAGPGQTTCRERRGLVSK